MRAVGVALALAGAATAAQWCQPGQSCWPTQAEISNLTDQLDNDAPRSLVWTGPPAPLPSAIPVGSPNDQPLYGWGATGLEALFQMDAQDNATGVCFASSSERRGTCLAALRNNPLEGWRPFLTVYPLTEAHVQAAVSFAAKHSLCVAVAGTGHDFLNRHSCPGGVLIRTTLMCNITVAADGSSMTLGPGCNFNQATAAASEHGSFVAAGWGKTVGIMGWSLGGGHGPFANAVGLGVDQVMETRVVTANGSVARAARDENPDLLWALRGGGGSAFGVLTSITVRLHRNPAGGFVLGRTGWSGDTCPSGLETLRRLGQSIFAWMGQLPPQWSGLVFFMPSASQDPSQCGGNWTAWVQYAFLGDEAAGAEQWGRLTALGPASPTSQIMAFPDWYTAAEAYPLEEITPVPWTASGVPSVLVSNATAQSGKVMDAVVSTAASCVQPGGTCPRMQLYHDVAGSAGSPRSADVSISPAFRNAFLHFVYGWAKDKSVFLALGDGAYFSESDYGMPEDMWRQRYWGSNYARLSQIKSKWDPSGRFWCRRCVEGTPSTN